jgi:nitrogen fixation-related uncharacterized protein
MSAENIFIVFRILFHLASLGIIIGVIIWAIRNGQFSKQDHASQLPLEINEFENPKNDDHV